MLVGIIGHQVDQHVRNEQEISLISPGEERQSQEGKQGKGDERELFFVDALIDSFHGT